MFRRTAAVATFALAALAATLAPARSAGAQAPVTVDFAEYASPVARDYEATVGAPLTSQGFDFYQAFPIGGSRNVLGTWGTADRTAANLAYNRGGSVGLFTTGPGVEVDIYVAGDDPIFPSRTFDMFGIDVAHLFATPEVPVLQDFALQFFGVTASGGLVTEAFVVTAPAPAGGVQTPFFQTLRFGNQWRGLVNVFWNQNGQFLSQQHQFTNAQLRVTPEPGTWVLLGAGLAGVLVVARRRRAA